MGVFRQFPYSNFHEMNMDEIIKIIKNMLEEWAQYHAEWDQWMDQMEDDWSNYQDVMNTAWQNMQNFINNYFDNLDVQEEINNKIVSMIQTGEFGLLVNEYIPPAVNAWLNLNITQPTGVVIDTSLTVSGACADAKATGDRINNVQDQIIQLNYFSTHNETQGYVNVLNGSFVEASGFYESSLIKCFPNTKFVIILEKKLESQVIPEEPVVLNFYDHNGDWLQGSADYTHTATEISAADSKFGFGGWKYEFNSPNITSIAFWSTHYEAQRWNNQYVACFYETENGNTRFSGDTPFSAIYFDNLIPMNKINGIENAFDEINADTNVEVLNQLLYSDWSNFEYGYLNASGVPVQPEDWQAGRFSDYISVVPGTTVYYNLRIIGHGMMSGVAWYDKNHNFINSVIHEGGTGTWYPETGNVTLPENAYFIRISGWNNDSDSDAKAQYVSYYHYEKIKNYLEQQKENGTQWQNKKWLAFGTSLTDTNNSLGVGGTPTGKYVPYLQKLSSMQVINKGIAGGSIGIVPDVLDGNIMTAIKSSDNIEDIQDADIITIEGFVNDFVGNLPIGSVSDTTNTSLMGAIYEAVTYLSSVNENANIILLTDSTGQYVDSSHWFPVTRPNALGKYQYEYNDAIITIGKYLGCIVIDCGQKSQINQWHTEYLADWIHHSELGGKQYANTIWDELKNIHCNNSI